MSKIGRPLSILGVVVPLLMLLASQPSSAQLSLPEASAIEISILESEGRFTDIYSLMHPDAQAFIPESAVVGWYRDNFYPLGPGVITWTQVRYVDWTWPVTGKTYPNTAEVSFSQPFADGSITNDVIRLVEVDGSWRWFFGRSPEFVNEQISKYSTGTQSDSTTTGSCDGSAEWWKDAYPTYLGATYLVFTFRNLASAQSLDLATIQDYELAFADVYAYLSTLSAPTAATGLSTDLLRLVELYHSVAGNVASLPNMNPLSAIGAEAAIVQALDEAGNIELSIGTSVDNFVSTCRPLIVFVYGMGEDLPIGVLPGEVTDSSPILTCDNVREQVDVQAFFDAAGPGDPHALDRDRDGIPCEVGE